MAADTTGVSPTEIAPNEAFPLTAHAPPPAKGRVVVVTSGKGGVGKTTSTASFAYGLSELGYKVCVIDFDIGLRNLDLHLGVERRVIFDFVNVIQEECTLSQALIPDRATANLSLLAASQTRDKSALTVEGVERVLGELKAMGFDYIVCDSPAGIESGALHAMYFADEAIITSNPEISAVRDADKMIGVIHSKSRRVVAGEDPVECMILVTRYDAKRVHSREILSVHDIQEFLGCPVVGVVPESENVLASTNRGMPVIRSATGDAGCDEAQEASAAGGAYKDTVLRYAHEPDLPFRFLKYKQPSLFKRVMGAISGNE